MGYQTCITFTIIGVGFSFLAILIVEIQIRQINLKTFIKGVFNMFKSKLRKRVEELEQLEEKIEHLNTIGGSLISNLNLSRKENTKLQQQLECGIEHETVGEITIIPEVEYTFNLFGNNCSTHIYYEVCKTCGKKLKKFNTSIEADRRKAELMEIEANKIKDSCDKQEKELKHAKGR